MPKVCLLQKDLTQGSAGPGISYCSNKWRGTMVRQAMLDHPIGGPKSSSSGWSA